MKCLVNNSRAKRMKMRASVVSRYAQGKSHLRCIKVISALIGAATNFQIGVIYTLDVSTSFPGHLVQ